MSRSSAGGAPAAGRSVKVVIKSPDGRVIDIDKFRKASQKPVVPVPPASSGLTDAANGRIESESDRVKRLKKEAVKNEKERKEKEKGRKEAEGRRKIEEEARKLAKLPGEDKRLGEDEANDVTPPTPETASALDLPLRKHSKDISSPPMSALITARFIENLNDVEYPEGIKRPNVELNTNAPAGKFRYDRDFLLQFMKVCTKRPVHLTPLAVLGLSPVDQQSPTMSRGGAGHGSHHAHATTTPPGSRPGSVSLGRGGRHAYVAMTPSSSRRSFVGLGIGFGAPGFAGPFAGMGDFPTPRRKLTSAERFQQIRSAIMRNGPGLQFGGRAQTMRTNGQGGAGHRSGPTRSKRDEKSGDPNKAPKAQHVAGLANLEPVAPLQASANRWVSATCAGLAARKSAAAVDADSPEAVVTRKVKALLNKLTPENFDSISDQLVARVNGSEKRRDGRTLVEVTRLVFESATDDAAWSAVYARLCRKMLERTSEDVRDEGVTNSKGEPIAGGRLFRKYLLRRCQEDFERGWAMRGTTAAAAARSKGKDESGLCSAEGYAAQRAKRRGLGLIRFIGEIFKLEMLTERNMHQSLKKLLGNAGNIPGEERIESLCELLATVGEKLDTCEAKADMDAYFERIGELAKNGEASSRARFMLLDVIALRDRKWVSPKAVAAPTSTIVVPRRPDRASQMVSREAVAAPPAIVVPRRPERASQMVNAKHMFGVIVASHGGTLSGYNPRYRDARRPGGHTWSRRHYT